jgi:two-component sensor histidine kinase/HAMP domain-containing protein
MSGTSRVKWTGSTLKITPSINVMKRNRSPSIQQRFVRSLVLVISAVLFIYTLVIVIINNRSLDDELRKQLADSSTLAEESLAGALWQYNFEYINDFVDSLFLYPDIVYAQVNASDNLIKIHARQRYQNKPFHFFTLSNRFITQEQIIYHGSQAIGSIRLVMTRERIFSQIIKDSAMHLGLFVLLIAAMVWTMLFISRKHVFLPLSSLEETARKIGGGDMDTPIDTRRQDEIGQLATTFKLMMDNVKSITASRDELDFEVYERRTAESRLVALLAEKDLLAKEIHHRVKNNLQMIQSLLSLESGRKLDGSENRIFSESINRIKSIALVHETLYRSENLLRLDLTAYFRELIQHLSDIYYVEASKVAIHTHIDPLRLDLDTSISCGLIVNELVTNAFKYAFKKTNNGHLDLSLISIKGQTAELKIKDNGPGLPNGIRIDESETLGLRIVWMLAKDQLKGSLDVSSDNGLAVTIRFPLVHP